MIFFEKWNMIFTLGLSSRLNNAFENDYEKWSVDKKRVINVNLCSLDSH